MPMRDDPGALADALIGLRDDLVRATLTRPIGDTALGPEARRMLEWAYEHADSLAAALRSEATSRERVEGMRAELPENLRGDDVAPRIRMLRIGYEAQREREIGWGRAIRLMLPFVDKAGGEGLEWAEEGGDPRMDGAEIFVAVAAALGCEADDPVMTAMLDQGRAEIRALTEEAAS